VFGGGARLGERGWGAKEVRTMPVYYSSNAKRHRYALPYTHTDTHACCWPGPTRPFVLEN
jgi:hypothetical protein